VLRKFLQRTKRKQEKFKQEAAEEAEQQGKNLLLGFSASSAPSVFKKMIACGLTGKARAVAFVVPSTFKA
jgi:hypothetical protein